MAIRLGITGGIGSGKSVVSRLLEVMGAPIYVSDAEARRLMQTDGEIRRKLTVLLGERIYAGGVLDRTLLASYLFASEQHAHEVNAIVHPQVREDFRRWVAGHGKFRLVGMESAILFEAGFRSEVDKVLTVYAPRETRVVRVMERDGASREQVERRIRSQMDEETKCRLADYVVVNDGKTPLMPQVCELFASLQGSTAHGSLPCRTGQK